MKVLTIQRLEVFRAVYEAGSLSQAAKVLGLAQPTVSRHLSNFQYAIGVDLFVNVKGRLRPTLEADRLFAKCSDVFTALEQVEHVVHDIQHGSEQNLRVMTLAASAQLPFFSDTIGRLRKKWPMVHVTVSLGSGDQQADQLRAGNIDLGLGPMRGVLADIDRQHMVGLKMVAIVPDGHELAKKAVVDIAEFTNYSSVLPAEGTIVGRLVSDCFRAHSVTPINPVNAGVPMHGIALAKSLNSLAIVDILTASYMPADMELKAVPLSESIELDLWAQWPAGRHLGLAARFLIDDVKRSLSGDITRLEQRLLPA